MPDLAEYRHTPIPLYPQTTGWQSIPVNECGEGLISVSKACDNVAIVCTPKYFEVGIQDSLNECYLRKGVLERLQGLKYLLTENGMHLRIWDAWRPVRVQHALYTAFRNELREKIPNLSEDELDRRTQTYVSLPSEDPTKPSPHLTGAAVDLTLAKLNGQELNMGTEFDDFSILASTRYYEELERQRELSVSEIEFQQNRRLLYHLMCSVGLTNYAEEWWHYDFGNQFWATVTSSVCAIYGPILCPPP